MQAPPPPFQQVAPQGGYYNNNAGPRKLQLYGDEITDSDNGITLYNVNHRSSWAIFSSKPHTTITRAGNNNNNHNNYYQQQQPPGPNVDIGTIRFHSLSPPELTIYGRPAPLQKTRWGSRGRSFQSAATGNTLIWHFDSAWTNSMTCSIDNGSSTNAKTDQWLARYKQSTWSMSKVGALELASPAVNGILLDEIVVSAVALVEEQQRNADAAGAAGDSSAAVGAAVSA